MKVWPLVIIAILILSGPLAMAPTTVEADSTGNLAITISGIPSTSSVEVYVTGPNGYSALPNIAGGATDTLTGLTPSTYTLEPGLTAGYQPTQGSYTETVSSGATTSVTITYESTTVTVSQVNLIASPTSQVADGSSQVSLEAIVIGSNGLGMSGQTVAYTTSIGTLSSSTATTNSGGQAMVYLTSTQTGTATVQASSNGVYSTTSAVIFTSATGSLAITLTGFPSSQSAQVSVTGPNGYNALPSISGGGTDTLAGLVLGTYTVEPGQTAGYQPTQGTYTETLVAGSTTSVTIPYQAVTPTISQVNLIASPTTQAADGASQVTLEATVLGSNGLGMSGQTVTFTTTLGTLSSATAMTNSGGQATAYLTSTQTGTATIQASSGGVSSTQESVTFTSSTGSLAMTINGPPSSILVEVSVTGPNGYSALPTIAGGATDTLTGLTPGTYTISGGLGADGWQPTQASEIVAVIAGQTASVTITYTQVTPVASQVNLIASPTTQIADGNSQVTLEATVIGSNGLGMNGQTVTFTTTLGTLSSLTATTNSAGQATVYLTSKQTGTATVQASTGGISSSAQSVTFAAPTGSLAVTINGPPSSLSFEVSVSGPGGYSALPTIAGGATDTLTGLAPGTYIVEGGLGADGWQPSQANETITVNAGGTASLTITYVQIKVTVAQVNLIASPTTQTADGTSQVVLQATVLGTNGLGMSDQMVTFTTSLGTLSSSTATTNSGGQASVYLTSTQPGTATVLASSGGVSGSTASVTFMSSTGGMAITISNLPSSLSVEVSVSGPNGYSTLPTIAGGTTYTLTGLAPGTYTVAGGLGADNWQPAQASLTIAVSAGQTAAVTVAYQQSPPPIVQLTLAAGPLSQSADGSSYVVILAEVIQSTGLGVGGVAVTFTTTLGTMSSTTAVTDGGGQATVYLTSTETGVASVQASYDGLNSNSVSVTFTAPTTTSSSTSAGSLTVLPGTSSTTQETGNSWSYSNQGVCSGSQDCTITNVGVSAASNLQQSGGSTFQGEVTSYGYTIPSCLEAFGPSLLLEDGISVQTAADAVLGCVDIHVYGIPPSTLAGDVDLTFIFHDPTTALACHTLVAAISYVKDGQVITQLVNVEDTNEADLCEVYVVGLDVIDAAGTPFVLASPTLVNGTALVSTTVTSSGTSTVSNSAVVTSSVTTTTAPIMATSTKAPSATSTTGPPPGPSPEFQYELVAVAVLVALVSVSYLLVRRRSK